MSKCTRSLSLILTLILSFSLFSVNAFAVDDTENLIDSDLSNWIDVGESLSTFQSVDITSSDNNNIISVESNSKGVAIIYDLTEFLKIGESYQFSFTLPNTNSTGLESYSLNWYLANSVDGPVASESRVLVTVTNSNKSNFLGDTVTYEFTYNEGYSNTCIALYIWGNDGLTEFPSTNFYINDVSLTRVTTESEKKLDGILGWLQDIWDKLVSIGDGLTDVWTNITSSVSALGDRISSFFSDLGNKIADEFTALTSDFSGYISSLGDRFSEFITSLGDRISSFFENLSVNISGFFTDLLDGIKEFFKGFGNLILYFNWEGEYTNPFESSNSIIGGGSDGEDDIVENENILKLEGSWRHCYTSAGTSEFTCNDGVYKLVRYAGNRYFCFYYNDIVPMKPEYKTILHFTTYDYNISDSSLTLQCKYSGGWVAIDFDGPGSYSIELPSFSSDNSFSIEIFDYRYDDGNYWSNDLDYWIYIKDMYVEYVSIYDDGSTGDTGSDEEGTTENVSVQGALDNILEYLSTVTTDIENVMDSITGSIKLFSDFCDEFPFVKALCIFVLALIIYSTVIGL